MRVLLLALWVLASLAHAAEPLLLVDAHIHYRWDQAENTSPEQALKILDDAGVSHAVVIGRPAALARALYDLAPERILMLYGPYLEDGDKLGWQSRKALLTEAREGLESGLYKGIGELHLIGGMAMHWRRSPVFRGLLEMAREFSVPVMIHTEYSHIAPTLSICTEYADVRLILAHAGATLDVSQLEELLNQCPNLAMDLAARDPWRFVATPITDRDGKLLREWRRLLLAYSDRFMLGSDPVWPVDRGMSWDQADQGWLRMSEFLDFHRGWLVTLPADVALRIARDNAIAWYGIQ